MRTLLSHEVVLLVVGKLKLELEPQACTHAARERRGRVGAEWNSCGRHELMHVTYTEDGDISSKEPQTDQSVLAKKAAAGRDRYIIHSFTKSR